MNAEVLKSPRLPFNPSVLRWAREWRGRSLEEAAQKVNVNEEKVASQLPAGYFPADDPARPPGEPVARSCAPAIRELDQ